MKDLPLFKQPALAVEQCRGTKFLDSIRRKSPCWRRDDERDHRDPSFGNLGTSKRHLLRLLRGWRVDRGFVSPHHSDILRHEPAGANVPVRGLSVHARLQPVFDRIVKRSDLVAEHP